MTDPLCDMSTRIYRLTLFCCAPLLFAPLLLNADEHEEVGTFGDLVSGVVTDLISGILFLLLALTLLVFLWGVAKFILKSDSETEREKGKQVMIWGLIGIFVMVSVTGIVYLVAVTFFDAGDIFRILPEDGGEFEVDVESDF